MIDFPYGARKNEQGETAQETFFNEVKIFDPGMGNNSSMCSCILNATLRKLIINKKTFL
jgi:hypothetical protein